MPQDTNGWPTLSDGTASLARMLVVIATILVISSGGAQAQSMDYGALESLFGEPVTTSVTGAPQRASDVPTSTTIVTQDEIRRSGARDIPGVLRHVAGIDVLQWTNDQADVAARGYNQAYSSRLLVLVDGRQVYADHYGYTPWATLPIELSDIRQIEVVFGPNSALFGFNATGGVINIVTYDPLYDDVQTGSIAVGTQGLVQGSATATFKLSDDAGLRLSLGGYGADDFSTPQQPSEIGTRQSDNRKAIDILGHARLGSSIDASLELSHSEASEPEITPLYTTFYVKYRTQSVKAAVTADTNLGILQATAYGNWFKGNAIAPTTSFEPDIDVSNSVYVVKLRDIFKIGTDHTVRLSAEYRHNQMATTPLGGANVFYEVFSAGAMWQWSIEPEMSLTNAVRVDDFQLGRSGSIPPGFGLSNAYWNRGQTAVSFNSGLVWRADEDDTVRVMAARGVQLPNLLDLGGLLLPLPPAGYASGISTVKPTVVTNYELSWDRRLPDWDAELHLRGFHQISRDISSNGGGTMFSAGLISIASNIGSSNATGLELALSGVFADTWRWGLSYTPEIINDHFYPSVPLAVSLVNYEDTHPTHIVKANLGWAQGPWEVDGYFQYESEFEGIQGSGGIFATGSLVRIPSYVSLDGRIAYQVTPRLTLSLSGQNLLQSPQKQTSAADVERRIEFTLTVGL